jgi:hypothetical protein
VRVRRALGVHTLHEDPVNPHSSLELVEEVAVDLPPPVEVMDVPHDEEGPIPSGVSHGGLDAVAIEEGGELTRGPTGGRGAGFA